MATLAEAFIKGGIGTLGFVASAVTLAKFIVATPVKIGERNEVEHDMDLLLAFDEKKYSKEAVDFFVQLVRTQSRLLITPKPKSVRPSAENEDHATYYLVGVQRKELVAIKEHKEKLVHAELVQESDSKEFDSGERIDLIMWELNRLEIRKTDEDMEIPKPLEAEEQGLLFQQALHSRLVLDYFPLHDDQERHQLVEKWVKRWLSPQPINDVRAYFGDDIGFYFAFLEMYSRWLVIPSVLGIIAFSLEYFRDWGVYGRAFYSLFITSWATAFLKFWKRRESTLQNEWGIAPADAHVLEPSRPEFTGEKRYDVVEGRYYTYFSSIKRMQRYIATTLVTLVVLGVILKLMFIYFDVERWVTDTFTEEAGWDGVYQYVSVLPSIVYSVVVLVLDAKYADLANELTMYENHRTDSDFSNALVLKLASFYFVNNFGSLFFLAFQTRDMDLLQQTLSSLLITRQLIGNVKEQLVPYLSARSSLKTEAGKIAKESQGKEAIVDKVDAELLFPTYEGTFEDYLELFVQFGQVTLFASAYPLAAVWSLANNIMEIRSDAFKLCVSFRRSRRVSSHGIGTWQYAFSALGYMSVVTNCAIFGLHSGLLDKLFPDITLVAILVSITIMEHVMIGVKVCIEMFVPDMPTTVVDAQRMRHAAMRKKALLQVELSSRKLQLEKRRSELGITDDMDAIPTNPEEIKEWVKQEQDRRLQLEDEVKGLNELYMKWIREEQAKRKRVEQKLALALKTSSNICNNNSEGVTTASKDS